jgi:hypothetical protein
MRERSPSLNTELGALGRTKGENRPFTKNYGKFLQRFRITRQLATRVAVPYPPGAASSIGSPAAGVPDGPRPPTAAKEGLDFLAGFMSKTMENDGK